MALVIFDLDHTLFRVNSSFNFGLFLYRKRLMSKLPLFLCLWHYICHKWFASSINTLHHQVFLRLFQGRKACEVQAEVALFLAESWEKMLNPSVFKELIEAQKKGLECAIFSSAPSFMVEAVAKRLGISCWIGTRYQVDRAGRFSSVAEVIEGREKALSLQVEALRRGLSCAEVTAYTDSYLDLALLEAVGRPVAVAPDKKLKKVCKQKGWRILSL